MYATTAAAAARDARGLEEAGCVLVEDRPVRAPGFAELALLARPFPRRHEHRPGRGDREEPAGEHDVVRSTPGHGPQHEPGRDGRDVEDSDVLQPVAVGEGDQRVGPDDDREIAAVDERGEAQAGDEEDEGCDLGVRHAQVTGRDRTQTLARVLAVALRVERVVQEVGAAGDEAQRHEGDRGPADDAGLVQDPGRAGRGEDQHVLEPLLRSGGADDASHRARSDILRPDPPGGGNHDGER